MSSPVWQDLITLLAVGVAGAVAEPAGERVWRAVKRLTALRRYQTSLTRSAEEGYKEAVSSATVLKTELREKYKQPEVLAGMSRPEPYFYATGLLLTNLRCFSHARMDLRFPGEDNGLALPNVNLLLGDNGSGKSTILRAIAMAALGPVLDSSGFVPYRLVREGKSQGGIAGSFLSSSKQGPRPLFSSVRVTRRIDLEKIESDAGEEDWRELYSESNPSYFIVGYGTNRRISDSATADPSLEQGRRRRRYQRVSSLFDDNVPLVPLGAWLPRAEAGRKADVEDLFSHLLPEGAYFTGIFEGGEPVFHRSGFKVPLRALSDGFRSYIGWLSDLLYQMNAAAPRGFRLQDVGGIALVDEVDLLLHPSWQRVVVPAISRALPKIQFVFTTHSPIVTGTLQAHNIIVCREDHNSGISTLERISAEVYGLNAEQVLLSSYFELNTTRAPGANRTLEELGRQAVLGDSDATKEYLRALAHGGLGPEGDSDR